MLDKYWEKLTKFKGYHEEKWVVIKSELEKLASLKKRTLDLK